MSPKNILISLFLLFPATIFCIQNVPVTRPANSQTIHQEKIQPAFEEIVSQIFNNVPAGKVVAFVEFTNSSGEVSKFSQAIFQEIEPVMINAGIKKGISFIERKDLKLLLDEWDLKSIFPSKADTGAQMLLGADYILTGKARLSKDNVQCAFKLVDLKDGRIIGTTIANLPAEDEFYIWENAKPPEKKIEIISGPNKVNSEDRKLSVWTNKKTYQIGEKIQIFFEVKEPLYVELIDVTPEGQITTIFPNPDQTDNYCMPGRIYSIPPENGSFELVITPPTGFDRIKALASTSPFSGTVNIKTRGIQFTKNIIKRASTRANLSFEIQ
jgi:TolB-like protein